MYTAKSLYKDYKKRVEDDLKKKSELEQNPVIIDYLSTIDLIERDQEDLKDICIVLFEECGNDGHEFVTTKKIGDKIYCGCIKCGLDEKVITQILPGKNVLSFDEKVAYDYLHKHRFQINGHHTGVECDIKTATETYQRLVNENPDAEKDEIIELFKSVFSKNAENKESKETDIHKTMQKTIDERM